MMEKAKKELASQKSKFVAMMKEQHANALLKQSESLTNEIKSQQEKITQLSKANHDLEICKSDLSSRLSESLGASKLRSLYQTEQKERWEHKIRTHQQAIKEFESQAEMAGQENQKLREMNEMLSAEKDQLEMKFKESASELQSSTSQHARDMAKLDFRIRKLMEKEEVQKLKMRQELEKFKVIHGALDI